MSLHQMSALQFATVSCAPICECSPVSACDLAMAESHVGSSGVGLAAFEFGQFEFEHLA